MGFGDLVSSRSGDVEVVDPYTQQLVKVLQEKCMLKVEDNRPRAPRAGQGGFHGNGL